MVSVLAGMLAAATPVTVEIVTSGHIETPADRFRLSGSVLACAATQAEADALLVQKRAGIERAMTLLGVAPAPASIGKPSLAGMMSGIMSARTASDCNKPNVEDLLRTSDATPTADKKDQVGASASLSYDAPDRATATRAIAALKAADAKPGELVMPVLLDETAARQAAKQQALARARAEADAYARPLGSAAPVLVGISERQDFGSLDFFTQMMRTIGLPAGGASDKVVTDITLTVQFRLDGAR